MVCQVFKFFVKFWFQKSASDHSMFIKRNGDSFLCLMVYVDDIILVGKCNQDIETFKQNS